MLVPVVRVRHVRVRVLERLVLVHVAVRDPVRHGLPVRVPVVPVLVRVDVLVDERLVTVRVLVLQMLGKLR